MAWATRTEVGAAGAALAATAVTTPAGSASAAAIATARRRRTSRGKAKGTGAHLAVSSSSCGAPSSERWERAGETLRPLKGFIRSEPIMHEAADRVQTDPESATRGGRPADTRRPAGWPRDHPASPS
ncbi:hypothetical protein GCM10009751_39110 [Myceligenerans crystallogenes]|uniref:Secreted protein n=1 Tax=Myceligenerans crystallogenes TaxID=316335 RepID=A0ABN2NQC7_9MICO